MRGGGGEEGVRGTGRDREIREREGEERGREG